MSPESPELFEEIAAQLLACERALLDPIIRRDRARVSALLAEDFVEFGSSGRIWRRDEILDMLHREDFVPPLIEDFSCSRIADNAMLVTYRTVRDRSVALRSSIWTHQSGQWKMRFHQGTRASDLES